MLAARPDANKAPPPNHPPSRPTCDTPLSRTPSRAAPCSSSPPAAPRSPPPAAAAGRTWSPAATHRVKPRLHHHHQHHHQKEQQPRKRAPPAAAARSAAPPAGTACCSSSGGRPANAAAPPPPPPAARADAPLPVGPLLLPPGRNRMLLLSRRQEPGHPGRLYGGRPAQSPPASSRPVPRAPPKGGSQSRGPGGALHERQAARLVSVIEDPVGCWFGAFWLNRDEVRDCS